MATPLGRTYVSLYFRDVKEALDETALLPGMASLASRALDSLSRLVEHEEAMRERVMDLEESLKTALLSNPGVKQ